MIDLYLKFDSYDHMMQVYRSMNLTLVQDDTEFVSQGGHAYSLWEVGTIPGRDGYHVNMRVIDPTFDHSALEPYQVFPQNPVCVWA
jgi:hypothetical protein